VQSFALAQVTSQEVVAHCTVPAQLPAVAALHCRWHASVAVHITRLLQEPLPLHVTLHVLPAHVTSLHDCWPVHAMSHDDACVQSTVGHVPFVLQSTVHGMSAGHVMGSLHGVAPLHEKAHAPASEHVPPALVQDSPQAATTAASVAASPLSGAGAGAAESRTAASVRGGSDVSSPESLPAAAS
jgi:hypothetical protein